MIHDDDPTLKSEFSDVELRRLKKPLVSRNLNSGVNRTLILSLIPGASESWKSVRLIFDSWDFKPLYEMSKQFHFEVVFPNDGKMQNYLLGLQPHSSFHPSPYSLYSQFTARNNPGTIRTIKTIIADNEDRINTNQDANQHHSVGARPIQALVDHPNENLLDVVTIAPLHNGVLLTSSFVEMSAKLDLDVTAKFISDLPFTRDRRQGNDLKGFAGNHSRIIMKSMRKLRKLLPRRSALTQDQNSKSEIDYSSEQYKFEAMWELTDVIEALSDIVHTVTSPKLYLQEFHDAHNRFTLHWRIFSQAFLNIFPRKHRHLTSPKIQNILVHLPDYIDRHQHSLFRVHEQAFETFHKTFNTFEKTIPFPKVGFWVPPKSKSTSSTDSVASNAPSFSTRSGAQHKRRKTQSNAEAQEKRRSEVRNMLLALAEEPLPNVNEQVDDSKDADSYGPRRLTNVENIEQAQEGRLLAIVSWNSKRFDECISLQRLFEASQYCSGDPQAPWNSEF